MIGILLAGPGEKLVKKARMKESGNVNHEIGNDGSEETNETVNEKEVSGNKISVLQTVLYVLAFIMLLWCMIRLSSGSYNPFIYFRF